MTETQTRADAQSRAGDPVGVDDAVPLDHAVIRPIIAGILLAMFLSARERPLYQSYSAVMFMAASIMGPVLGGLLTDYMHWSLIFWINLPLGAVALIMSDRALRKLPRNDRPHRLDFLGTALMVLAALVLMLALAWGGRRYAWGSPQIVAMIAASALLWGLFALRLAR